MEIGSNDSNPQLFFFHLFETKIHTYILVCFTQYKFCFKSKGSSKNIEAYDPTKASVKFQTSGFPIEDALAHQKCEEIGGRSPSTCHLKRKFHPSVRWFFH
jgi:hypothetical protein